MKRTITLLLVLFSFVLQAQDYIVFNDPNLKAAILANPDDVDSNDDDEIQFSEAEYFTGTLELSISNIDDATGLEYFDNISEVHLGYNNLSSIDLTANDKLIKITVHQNNLTSINISGLLDLERLTIWGNNLSSIDVSSNTALTYIHLNNNNLNALTVDELTLLETLYCSNNSISELDLKNNQNLINLNCSNNSLSVLDTQNHTALENVYCNDNNLYTLDLTSAENLELLNCQNNNLISLNLITSGDHNTPSNTLDCDNNTNLTCINVKYPTTFTAVVPNVTIPTGASFSNSCAVYVDIPDANFEQKLIDLGIDADPTLNRVLLKTDAEAVTGTLNLDGLNISDLTGINYFSNLGILRAINNNLTELNITNITGLTGLILSGNNIVEINLTQNLSLSTLQISNNEISTIDLSQNTLLEYLTLANNHIETLLLDVNSSLIYVNVDANNLYSFTISMSHPNLTEIHCANNGMSGDLDLTDLENLTKLYFNNNQIENGAINLGNLGIEILVANDNLFSGEMNFTFFSNLKQLNLANNVAIEHIDLRNDNNTTITTFNATGCTSLENICVDDATWSTTATGWSVDDTDVFSTCTLEISDANFEQALIDLGIDTYHDDDSDPVPNGFIDITDPVGVTYLPISNKGISNLIGINYFTDLEALIANNNQVTGIDVSALSKLRNLNLKNNQLDSYHVTLPNPSDLRNLYVDDNTEFVGGNHFNNVIAYQNLLEKLTLANNNAALIELTNFPNLLEFDCSNNPAIDELDVSNSPQLKILKAANCSITTLDVSSIHSLDEIQVQDNEMTSFVLGNQPHFNSLRCFNNSLTELVVSGAPHLGFLSCSGNQLASLDISNNHELSYLGTSHNTAMLFLNLNNGNNATALIEVYATNLGGGCCIQVDDETSIPVAWNLDTTDTTITNDCTPDVTYVPDNNFENWLKSNGYDDVMDDYVLTANINTLISLDIHGENITDLTGIEDFIALEELYLYNNNLENIDLFSNIALTELSCGNNHLSTLDVSNNTLLTMLACSSNNLTSLNLSLNSNLTSMNCSGNELEELDIKNGNNTNIIIFNASSNSSLSCINVDNAAYSTTNWTNIDTTSTFVETVAECAALGTSSETFEMGINLYPNPVTNLLTIEISNDIQLEKVSLFDIMGKQIRIEENSTTISFEYLPSGIYLIKLQDTDGNSITKKIIKR